MRLLSTCIFSQSRRPTSSKALLFCFGTNFSAPTKEWEFLNSFDFVNKIVEGKQCNGLGAEKYVQNTDGGHNYNVTVKIIFFEPGVGNSESQKVVFVPAGGKTYLGCSAGLKAGVTYTYSVVGESTK